jgi:dihydroorotate dehydrogenase
MYYLIQKILFTLDAEVAHELTLFVMNRFSFLSKFWSLKKGQTYQVKVGDMTWDFPVGLAAGLDKNARAVDFLLNLGFGAVEVGTVTPQTQDGNDKPRLFRLKNDLSLRNRMGFNNAGAKTILANLLTRKKSGIVGVNLGKNKVTPNNLAADDYLSLYQAFAPHSDYLVINLSSPNTPGLRDLLDSSGLKQIFEKIKSAREKNPCPLYLKISPDLEVEQIEQIVKCCKEYELSGIIATNTTIRSDLGEGGISGQLLREKSQKIRSLTLSLSKEIDNFHVIGVGGVNCYDDLKDFWREGGRVMQIYTSFIYQGPAILKILRTEMDQDLVRLKLKNVEELIAWYGQKKESKT